MFFFFHVSHSEGIGQIGDQKWRRDSCKEELNSLNFPSSIIDRVFFHSSLVLGILPTPCRCRGLLLCLNTLGDTHTHNESVRLLWTSDQLAAQTSTWQHTTLTTDRHPCPSGTGTCTTSKQAKNDALDRAANGIGLDWVLGILTKVL